MTAAENIFYRASMSDMRASTSSGLVAQLVQKRTAVCPSSILPQWLKLYFSASFSSAASGTMGNCWLVGES